MSTTVEDAPQTTHHRLNGIDLTIRPIKHTDQMLEKGFVNRLSDEAKRCRFFGSINELSDKELARFCDVDYRDSMAFIALESVKKHLHEIGDVGYDKEVGVVRYCKEESGGRHEMAITIADDYRDSKLPKILLEQLIEYARTHDVATLYSIELYNDEVMRGLASQFDMQKEADPNDPHQIIYSLSVH